MVGPVAGCGPRATAHQRPGPVSSTSRFRQRLRKRGDWDPKRWHDHEQEHDQGRAVHAIPLRLGELLGYLSIPRLLPSLWASPDGRLVKRF
jgi:hypothetical protein